ncbi:MAG: substrate-binding domain-containing protein [Clostridiales bacterium]|jgi:LacI family transcriptional regulator/LacI family purine nucleotide synthesis repressor|nr:substrate-binding domain-containing protein [Clostridiales bacterium]
MSERNRNRKPGDKKTTMDDIAKSLNISKNSVSLALGGKAGVSDELRSKIFEKAEELRYGGYAAKAEPKNRCILVIVPEYLHNDNFFYSEIFWTIETEAKRHGFISVNAGISKEMEEKEILPVFPKSISLAGLICIGVLSEKYMAALASKGYPMLSVDIAYNSIPIACVGSANLSGGYLAANHLIGMGHKKIGFIGPIFTALSVYERWCGFNLAMRHAGLAKYDGYCITGSGLSFKLFDIPEAFEASLDEMKEFPTAWFCAGDRIAVALMNLLSQRGLKIPDDISVIGFDDIPLAQMILPKLTTIRIDRKLMGRLAVKTLVQLIEDPEEGVVNLNISGKLMERDSVRPPKQQP